MADQDYGSKVVWLMAGVAIGSTIALLYAPASGHETRRKLAKKTQEGREQLAESGKEMLDRGRELFERAREVADEAAETFDRARKLVRG